MTTQVFETRRPARIDCYSRDSGALGEIALEAGMRSTVGAPVLVAGALWGLVVAGRTHDHTLLPAHAETRAELDRVGAGLSGVLEALREMARGIHPAILAHGGLRAALKTVARRCPVPVEIEARLDRPLPEPVEVAAYYVVSEALTNVAKYARASVVHVEVAVLDGSLCVGVRDDGIGGAEPARGTGLVSLRDRTEALGGTMRFTSPPGEGTSLRVELPLEQRSAV